VPESILVVIGDDPVDALQSMSDQREKISSVLKEKGLESKVYFLGTCSEEILDDAYFAADILVFPVQKSTHDIEGFGMVAIEAAAHGLPTVAFAVGGVSDAVSNGCSGKLIPPGDNVSFSLAVVEYLQRSTLDRVGECRKFAQLFRWTEFGIRLRTTFINVKREGVFFAGN
jgi:phosphatidyl-myo-inositol dimannoside synthase